jgi:hypothetical protein
MRRPTRRLASTPSNLASIMPRAIVAGDSDDQEQQVKHRTYLTLPRAERSCGATVRVISIHEAGLVSGCTASWGRTASKESRGFDPAGYPAKPLVSYQVLPTTSWVDPSSTGEPRRWGALRYPGTLQCNVQGLGVRLSGKR